MSLFSGLRKADPGTRPVEGRLPDFDGATGWLNSEPLTAEGLRGKVVLVDFWTYTCINWLRTLGYVRAWWETYADRGLVVVGVHTPEFPFEHDIENVRNAVKEMRVVWPVALDNDYAVWRAFDNHYWPAVYIADPEGRIRHHYFGEGGYEECERVVQRLLGLEDDLVAPVFEGLEVQADWASLQSPETYLGSEQTQNFAGADARELKLNHWSLSGDWTIEGGKSVLNGAEGGMAFRFHARDVNLVMGPPARGESVPFSVLVDGEPPADAHGLDVDEQGRGTLAQQRLHQLIREPGSITDRTFEIRIEAAGAEAYCFTFG
jgi:Thioredoxin like C-terminal domain/AhpC/TSA family